jgi:hypothetical protein
MAENRRQAQRQMLTQNFRTSAQSALISAIMAVSTFALVIGPDPVRYGALAALLVLAPTVMLAIRIAAVVVPELDPKRLENLEIAPAPKIDQALIAAAWLGVAGAFVTGLAAVERFALPGGDTLEWAALIGAAAMALGATPVIAGLLRPWPTVTLTAAGIRLSPTRLVKWRDIDSVRCVALGLNYLLITLKPSPRDPGGPPQRIRARLPAVIEPWIRTAAMGMIDRHLED